VEDRQRYFEDVGWDERGVPKSSELKRMGLQDVDKKLRRFLR
jgi:aldehyde:ferredoxin oxidoreductase